MTAQVKNRFKILSTYLGQDKAGQAMLKDLKDAVNVLRKKAAATTEATTDAEASRAAAVDRAKESDSALKDALQELRQVWGEVRRLTQLVEAKPVVVSKPPPKVESDAKAVIKRLRTGGSSCPRNTHITDKISLIVGETNTSVFDRESIAEGWGHDAMWRIGATVAIISGMMGGIIITTDQRFSDFKEQSRVGGLGRHIMQWYRPNLDTRPDVDSRLYDAGTMQQHRSY